jgi:hypothetical protein
MLKEFYIDEQYITDVMVREEHDLVKDRANPTNDDLVLMLKGWDKSVMVYTKDHDEFTKLRNQLEELGYIVTERKWWNGDYVLRSFKLNGWTFRKDQKFPCAAAIQNSMACARKFGWKSLGF